ncbi:hAT dimerization domain-containing protein [Actinidia rufa]|uniref:HAT dimerization domain-containing protein n=1 Tax=Actinidia rufa TaxID=165716 RepID=A0A7J0EPF0_9ERIC|nr:hAT dimerization domain-containing protein [Actinidia rufa]
MHMMPDFDEINNDWEDDEDDIVGTDRHGKSIRNSQSSISFPPKNRGKQTKIDANDPYKKEIRDRAVTRFTRWMYDAGISFNAVTYPSFGPMIESIGQYGPGMKPPSYHETRVTYLKKELAHTNDLMKDHRENWVKYGCSIMADGWTDGKGRTLINFLVNCPKGSMFIESIDASSYSPLIRVLRLVDTEKKPPMGYIYEAMDRAKESIASSFGEKKEKYEDIFKIIDHRALKRRYDMRDTIDPISLSNIDESNEWLYGSLDGESDEDEELVFEDDTLTWGAVARASGVGESSKQTRTTTSRVRSKGSTSISNTIHLIDEEDTSSEETEEDAEEYKSNGEDDEDVDLLVVDVEDDF